MIFGHFGLIKSFVVLISLRSNDYFLSHCVRTITSYLTAFERLLVGCCGRLLTNQVHCSCWLLVAVVD